MFSGTHMTYAEEMRAFFNRIGLAVVTRAVGPVPGGHQYKAKRVTTAQLRKLDSVSRERGYRRFSVEMMER